MSDLSPSRFVRRLRHLVRRGDAEREMDEEMRHHLALEIEDRVKQGMSPDEARRTALVDFGGVEKHKEDARTARGVRPIEDLAQDLDYAARVLRKSPGFTIASVLTVAIGVAATTVVFSAADTLLVRPLPVPEPRQLFVVGERWKNMDGSISTSMGQPMYSYRHYLAVRDATTDVFSGLAGFRYGMLSLRVGDDARALSSVAATPNYFRVLALRPALGRWFTDSGSTWSGAPEVVIGWDFWQGDLAGDSTVIGRTLWVDSRPMTIVGVAPRGFVGTMTGLIADLWTPATLDARPAGDTSHVVDPLRRLGPVTMFGRLRPELSRARAERALSVIAPNIEPDQPWQRMRSMTLDQMNGVPRMAREGVLGFTAMLLVTAGLVLAIAVANIAGMLLARGARRRREIAVRLTLGAWRGRLVRQLVAESVLLCLAGGLAGVLLARWLVSLVPAVQPPIGTRAYLDLRIDGLVLAVSFGAALVAGIAAGLTPALDATRFDLLSGLRGTTSTDTTKRSGARSRFVVAQLAMSLVLLVTAGLFIRALGRALEVDPGLDARRVVVAGVDLESHGYSRERGEAFYKTLLDRLRARPELEAAALGAWTPLSLSHNGEGVRTPNGNVPVTYGVSDGDYFALMRIPVLQGRPFDDANVKGATPVVIVNQTLAKRMWPSESPIGKLLEIGGAEREVIGVVKDGKYRSLDERPTAYAFLPFAQRYSPRMIVHVRARRDEGAALAAIRAEVKALDPNIALTGDGPLAKQLEIYYLPQRAAAWFVGAFGVVGLLLAVLGIYGVIAYQVAQRTRELGIRIALGAGKRDVIGMVLGQGVRVIAVGLGVGLVLALGVGRLASGFLYGVAPADPVTFLVVPVVLGGVALVASWVPARRAAMVDPMVSLRAD